MDPRDLGSHDGIMHGCGAWVRGAGCLGASTGPNSGRGIPWDPHSNTFFAL